MIIDFNNFDSGYTRNKLYYTSFSIESSLDALYQLNKNQEKSLEEAKKRLNEKIDSIVESNKNLMPEEVESFIDHLHYEEEIVIDELQRLQRYSIILSIFSLFEAKMKSICELIDDEFKYKIKEKDLNSNKGDLARFWSYLNKVHEIESASIKDNFDLLSKQKSFRNIIAHKDGYFNKDYGAKLPVIKGVKYKDLGVCLVLEFDKDVYIEKLIKDIRLFLKELLKIIDKRYKVLRNN